MKHRFGSYAKIPWHFALISYMLTQLTDFGCPKFYFILFLILPSSILCQPKLSPFPEITLKKTPWFLEYRKKDNIFPHLAVFF